MKMASSQEFLPRNIQQLLNECIFFHEGNSEKTGECERVKQNRFHISNCVEDFHEKCRTLTSAVQKKIQDLRNGKVIVLMTAHQPNLFAYSGVLRKTTLSFVLARKLEESLRIPAISIFGVADQDFTDDRWVKSATLPDVERRNGVLELRLDLPEKLILRNVDKPSEQVLMAWKNGIDDWLKRGVLSVRQLQRDFHFALDYENKLESNFGQFWRIVENAYKDADNFADFNAFIMSKIVNEVWGYDTLFARFSESQRIFEHEFAFLLSHLQEYSEYVKKATISSMKLEGGVSESESSVLPFWYECDCGSKARLNAEQQGESIIGHGVCVRCKREYMIDLGSAKKVDISPILYRMSARSLSMPLIFFYGLNVSCYIGGVAGREYLRQARYVAEKLGVPFPPTAVWRPKDVYGGIAQLSSCLVFKQLSGTFDFSHCYEVRAKLKEEIADVHKEIEELELEKNRLRGSAIGSREELITRMRTLSTKQNQIRRQHKYSLLSRNLELLYNVSSAMRTYPSIIDYAVNVGLSETSEQWKRYLENDGDFTQDVHLETAFGNYPGYLKDFLDSSEFHISN